MWFRGNSTESSCHRSIAHQYVSNDAFSTDVQASAKVRWRTWSQNSNKYTTEATMGHVLIRKLMLQKYFTMKKWIYFLPSHVWPTFSFVDSCMASTLIWLCMTFLHFTHEAQNIEDRISMQINSNYRISFLLPRIRLGKNHEHPSLNPEFKWDSEW